MKKGNTSKLEGVAFSRFLNGNGIWAGELGGNQDRAPSNGWCPIQLYVLWVTAGSDLCSALEPALPWSPGRTYSLLSTGSKEHSPVASSGIIFMLNFVLVLRRNDT